MQNKHVQRFHNKITTLKNLFAHLAKTIADKDAKHLLLDTAKNSLGIVERCLLPHGFKATTDNTEMWFRLIKFHLEVAEEELTYAKGVVACDCPNWLAYTFADWRLNGPQHAALPYSLVKHFTLLATIQNTRRS